MFRRHYQKKRTFLPFVVFRLLLSLIIFAILAGGIYTAYKQFSGVDPKGVDIKTLVTGIINTRNFEPLLKIFSVDVKQTQSIIPQNSPKQDSPKKNVNPVFTFALISDSHNENNYLKQTLVKAKTRNVKFVIGLGDYTEVGTIKELQDAKKEFDETGLRYFVTVGDHDLWDSRDKQKPSLENFQQVFGPSFQAFSFEGVKFLILDNSDNYSGLSEDQFKWLNFELDKTKKDKDLKLILSFLHEPLFHPSSAHTMGWVSSNLKDQAKKLTEILKVGGVKEVFSGDIHYFTRYNDPISGLNMTTIGAVASQRNTQMPRFAIVTINDDYSYNVEDIEIK